MSERALGPYSSRVHKKQHGSNSFQQRYGRPPVGPDSAQQGAGSYGEG